AFSPDQLNALVLMSLKAYGYGAGVFMVFYGVASIIHGYLIIRSGYLPAWIGAVLAVAGLGFVIENFLQILAPAFASPLFHLPSPLAAIALGLWFFFKGVDSRKWDERVAAATRPT